MKDWLKKLFSDSPEVSEMSVMCFLFGINAIALSWIKPDKYLLITEFISAAIGGKAWQKAIEVKKNDAP